MTWHGMAWHNMTWHGILHNLIWLQHQMLWHDATCYDMIFNFPRHFWSFKRIMILKSWWLMSQCVNQNAREITTFRPCRWQTSPCLCVLGVGRYWWPCLFSAALFANFLPLLSSSSIQYTNGEEGRRRRRLHDSVYTHAYLVHYYETLQNVSQCIHCRIVGICIICLERNAYAWRKVVFYIDS